MLDRKRMAKEGYPSKQRMGKTEHHPVQSIDLHMDCQTW